MTFEIEGERVPVGDALAALVQASRPRLTGLESLLSSLNESYGVDLAHLQRDTQGAPFLLVRRGSTVSDVMVAVSIEPAEQGDPLYRIEVYTWPAWCCSGDAFVSTVRETTYRARRLIEQYLPVDPAF